jgi:hypothetical protein
MAWLKDYPHLLAQLHLTKNLGLGIVPYNLRAGSNRRLWWRCPAGPDHEWQAIVNNRTKRRGCPFCSGNRVSVTNSLAFVAPEIARQWHPTKNGALKPRDVTSCSNQRVWWKCPRGREHEWQVSVSKRVSAHRGCPFCSGRYASEETSLAAVDPELAAEWHPTKNGALTPADVKPYSDRKVWWVCSVGPEHDWDATVANRAGRQRQGCPYCAGRRVLPSASLAALFPAIAAEWHPTKNGALTPWDVAPHAGRRVSWKCSRGPDHEWQVSVGARTRGATTGCPFCANKRLSVTNSLAALYPAVAGQWHPKKNGRLTPRDVVASTSAQAWWRCAFGHVWCAQIRKRTLCGHGCNQCRRRRQRAATRAKAKRYVHLASYDDPAGKKR